jgi:hypothetical protein
MLSVFPQEAPMPFYRCEICQDDGSVVATDVAVAIEVHESGPNTDWYGSITATQLTSLEPGQQYRLVLGDGRAGVFRVRRNTTAGASNRAISIVGAGPLA